MKRNNMKRYLLLACAFTLSSGIFAEEVDIYLIAGQSNATGQAYVKNIPACFNTNTEVQIYYSKYLNQGKGGEEWKALCPASESPDRFGVELSLGTSLKELFPNKRIALIKHALSGANLFNQWNPGNLPGNKQGAEYKKWMDTIKKGLEELKAQGKDPHIKAMIWQQGEGDALNTAGMENSKKYGENLRNFFLQTRKDLNAPDMVIVYGEVMPLKAERFTGREEVREGQYKVSEASESPLSVKDALLIEGDDLQMRYNDYLTPYPTDDVHLGTFGILNLGERFAKAIYVKEYQRTLDISQYLQFAESLQVGDETWMLPSEKANLKNELETVINELEILCKSPATNLEQFKQEFAQTQKRVKEKIKQIEKEVKQPEEYTMPLGLTFKLVRSTDNRTLMLSARTDKGQYCTSFEEEGSIVIPGKDTENPDLPIIKPTKSLRTLPEKVKVSPVLLTNKWDAENNNYYLYEAITNSALQLHDGTLDQALPGSRDYYAKARIQAYHRTTQGTVNIQGAEGGFTEGQYFQGTSGMAETPNSATYWNIEPVRQTIETQEKLPALQDQKIPVVMYENAQMTDTENKIFENLSLRKTMKAGRWYSISLPADTKIMRIASTTDTNEESVSLEKDYTLLSYINKKFVKVQQVNKQIIPAGTYLIRMKQDMEVAFHMTQVTFKETEIATEDYIAMGSGMAQNKEHVSGYHIDEHGEYFVYSKDMSVKPFEGFITFHGTATEATPIKISETTTDISSDNHNMQYQIDHSSHRIIMKENIPFELYHLSGIRISNPQKEQKPGLYILTIKGKSQIICL